MSNEIILTKRTPEEVAAYCSIKLAEVMTERDTWRARAEKAEAHLREGDKRFFEDLERICSLRNEVDALRAELAECRRVITFVSCELCYYHYGDDPETVPCCLADHVEAFEALGRKT